MLKIVQIRQLLVFLILPQPQLLFLIQTKPVSGNVTEQLLYQQVVAQHLLLISGYRADKQQPVFLVYVAEFTL